MRARLPSRQGGGAPGNEQAKHVGKIVSGVRQQRDRIGGKTIARLDRDKAYVEHRSYQEGASKTYRGMTMSRVRVPGMIVRAAQRFFPMVCTAIPERNQTSRLATFSAFS
jgi:hypothetical protein